MLLTLLIGVTAMILVDRWMKEYQSDQEELEQSIQALIDSIEQSRQVLTKRR